MNSFLIALFAMLASSFRIRAALQAEGLALLQQSVVLQTNAPRRLSLRRSDRLLWILLSRLWSGWLACLTSVSNTRRRLCGVKRLP